MKTRNTDELEKILGQTHPKKIQSFFEEQKESMLDGDRPFSAYFHELIKEKKLLQQTIFLQADIPERYGYKLLSEEKKTRQRDVILRLCYAAQFTLAETQRALKIYGMPQLYAKVPRDALIMVCFNERPGSIIEVNSYLKGNDLEPLKTSGVQE